MLSEWARWLASDPWVLALVSLATLVCLPLTVWGIVLTVRARREKRPCFSVRSFNLIDGAVSQVPEVEIKVHGHGPAINHLTISKVFLWNAGRDVIRKADLAEPKGITLRLKNGGVFVKAPEVVYETSETNGFSVHRSQDKTSVSVTFHHMDFNEGVVLRVFHTGTSDADIEVEGKVLGGGRFIRVPSEDDGRARNARLMPLYLIGGILLVLQR